MSQFQVQREALNITRIVESSVPSIQADEILVKVDSFAFTSNNLTYGVTGYQLGYWQFFPAHIQASEQTNDWGILPVWGFADVIASKSEEFSIGERFYGYFPPAEHLVMQPIKISKGNFFDGAEHRSKLPPGYNSYRRLNADPSYSTQFDNEQMLLFPLFITSFVIWDQLLENEYYNAEQIIIISASSKTSIGLAYALDFAQDTPQVIGLTSERNVDFVHGLGLYHSSATYSNLSKIDTTRPSVIIDMSGNKSVLNELFNLLGNNLQYCINVGLTHWEAETIDMALNKEKSEFFFAPSRIQKRMQDWGVAEFHKRSGAFMQRAALLSRDWLKPKIVNGLTGLEQHYADVAQGRFSPSEGLIVAMN